MITPYYGEFLVSTVPLEMSLNFCNFSCSYCFANLNWPHRTADIPALMRFLATYPERKTLEAHLLREGYPVLISNRDDAFAGSNYKQAKPVIDTLQQLGVPITYQTKGGKFAFQALPDLKPAVWYVSISMLDDALRAKIEPGAPTIESRFELLQALHECGHRIVVGLNPCVPEWLPDPAPLLERAKACGVEGVWIERMHLNYKQERNLTAREKDALTPGIITRAKKRQTAGDDWEGLARAYQACADLDLNVYSGGLPAPSDFWRPFREMYAKTFPNMQDFVNHCYENYADGTVLTFADFAKVIGIGQDCGPCALPQGLLPIYSYIGVARNNIWRDKKIPNQLTYEQLLQIIWSEPRAHVCPARIPCFAYAGRKDGDGWVQLVDEGGLPYLVFSSNWFDDIWTEVE